MQQGPVIHYFCIYIRLSQGAPVLELIFFSSVLSNKFSMTFSNECEADISSNRKI
jgi:hypothetical protein